MITYLKGDATQPQTDGHAIIAHICNDLGAWGAGFVLALSDKWSEPEASYRTAFRAKNLELGKVQFVTVEPYIMVANMVAQRGFSKPNEPAVDYEALAIALGFVRAGAEIMDSTVHMPRIGCGLGGGKWETIEEIINRELSGINTYVYDLQ